MYEWKPNKTGGKSTIILGEFNIPLSVTDKTSRQKISKIMEDMKTLISQCYLIDIYSILHLTQRQ